MSEGPGDAINRPEHVGDEPIEAADWVESAKSGGSRAQVFRLADDTHALVKFAQNSQGERVLLNEFISCRIGERLRLPVNPVRAVRVDEILLSHPKRVGECPGDFAGGVHCGMTRYDGATSTDPSSDLFRQSLNGDELHGVLVLEALVARGDSRQLLVYPDSSAPGRNRKPAHRFAAFDYGFAFGGSPSWTADSLRRLPPPQLPQHDALGAPYSTGDAQAAVTERLRRLGRSDFQEIIDAVGHGRWGLTPEEAAALVDVLTERAASIVRQYDERYRPQMEAFDGP